MDSKYRFPARTGYASTRTDDSLQEHPNQPANPCGIPSVSSIAPEGHCHNLVLAQSFLTALDEDAESFLFQTFDDNTTRKSKGLTQKFLGSLEQYFDGLANLNKQGAGVFVTVNRTSGKGRTKEDITSTRALFVDLDGAPLEPVLKSSPPPHIIVQTSLGRFHIYWRVSDCILEQCEPALRQLIGRFNADRSCSDRSRVLRLPGFYHCKQAPYLVHVIETSPGECCMADFGFDFQDSHLQKTQKKTEDDLSVLLSSSVGIPEFTLPQEKNQRNEKLFLLVRYLKAINPVASWDELRPTLQKWHRMALPAIGTLDFATTWADFRRGWEKVQIPYGEILDQVIAKATLASLPTGIEKLGYGDRANLLVRICRELQRNEGENPFFLSVRKAGELIGMHFTDANKVLNSFVIDCILELVEVGIGKKASRYRYVWPETPSDEE